MYAACPNNDKRESETAPPEGKYRPYEDKFDVKLPDRTWPDRRIERAPIWCSVDLRDGNQSIPNTMNVDQKVTFFNLLVRMGFKQIEIGFPAASEPDKEFTRKLIQDRLVPPGVLPQVLVTGRADLIEETFRHIRGLSSAIVHLYTPTSKNQRDMVFRKSKDEVLHNAVESTKLARKLSRDCETKVIYEFSPESFTATERTFARDVCDAVVDAWEPESGEKVIINLPSTVELSTPDVYADLIEWMHRNLRSRDHMTLSVHNHNDRGTGIAACELALKAGAERVEGTLFGNGERAGNLDIVVVGLNMFSQGVDPELSFNGLPEIRAIYEELVGLKVPERHPYAGDFSHVSFSGTHQNAIRKAIEYRKKSGSMEFDLPYIPLDPTDVGSRFRPVRNNSQSGKNGRAYVLETEFGCRMPSEMEVEYSDIAQQWSERHGIEISDEVSWQLFEENFIRPNGPLALSDYEIQSITPDANKVRALLKLRIDDNREVTISGKGNGPIDAATNALREIGHPITVISFFEHSRNEGSDSEAVAYLQVERNGECTFGVGIDSHSERACIKALIAGANRLSGI